MKRLLQEHQSKTVTVYKWQKSLKDMIEELITMQLTKKIGYYCELQNSVWLLELWLLIFYLDILDV